MKLGIIFFFLGFTFLSTAQVKVDTSTHKLLVGFETAGTFYNSKDFDTGKKYYWRSIATAPYVGLFYKKFIFGAKGGYTITRSNYFEIDDLYELGGFIRYYLPITIKNNIFFTQRVKFYMEGAVFKTNYYRIKEFPGVKHSPSETNLRLHLGMNYKIWRQLYIDIGGRFDYFIHRYTGTTGRLGFEYHF